MAKLLCFDQVLLFQRGHVRYGKASEEDFVPSKVIFRDLHESFVGLQLCHDEMLELFHVKMEAYSSATEHCLVIFKTLLVVMVFQVELA